MSSTKTKIGQSAAEKAGKSCGTAASLTARFLLFSRRNQLERERPLWKWVTESMAAAGWRLLDGGESLGRVLFFRTNKPAVSKVRRCHPLLGRGQTNDAQGRVGPLGGSKWALVASAGHLQWRRIRKEVGKSQATIVASRRAVDATDDTTCRPIETEALTCQ